jgi:nickel-dependent lactate racemase
MAGTIRLAYGKNGISIKTGDNWNLKVIEPLFTKGLADPARAISQALMNPIGTVPLREIAKPGHKVGIIFNDITRPTPNKIILETILKELSHLSSSSIILFNALGTHRQNSDKEIREMIGDYLADNFRIVQNNAFDDSTSELAGRSSFGHEIWINKELMSCDIKILTGFTEPHFFAGFSGGGKAIMPGMAGAKTILANHDARNIGNENSSWGITHGNPIWEEVLESALMAGTTFLVNVSLNRNKEITGVFAGDIRKAHYEGIDFVRRNAMVPVDSLFDIVVTTNSGYPLDLNLYQAVKGMSAASRVVKKGGIIIAAAECCEGIPEHGLFGRFLSESDSPAQLLEHICASSINRLDQWQAQILAMIRLRAEVYLYTDYLSDNQLNTAGIKRCKNIYNLIEELRIKIGREASICIIPEGPQTIPFYGGS